MANVTEVLNRILEEIESGLEGSRKAREIAGKIQQGKATYADAYAYARENSRIMTDSLKKNLPDALTDGRLYRAEADQVIRVPMTQSGEMVAETAAEIQQTMNEAAEIGINGIVPEVNEDQINGIITDICNADSYDAGKKNLFTQIENFLEGTVDDCVRENADFQYQAGLSPKIERRAFGKCCNWCDSLAGTYEYADVRNKGNDVFRRHKSCHCMIYYNPGDGSKRRQNVHSRQWTDDGKADRIKLAEMDNSEVIHQRFKRSELKNGLPIDGIPNSISDMVDKDGSVIQRRKYGKDGKASIDYDITDHNESWLHPNGAHKHVFDYSSGKPKRSKKEIPFTAEELEANSDIIIQGVNYFAEK